MKRIIYLYCLVLLICSRFALSQNENKQNTESSQINSTLFLQFRKLDSNLVRVELNDIKAVFADPIISLNKPNRFLVLARGIYFNNSDTNEKLGVFVFDDSLVSVLRTIDIINYAGDYTFTVAKIWKDTLTLHGESPGKGLQSVDMKYKLFFWDKYK